MSSNLTTSTFRDILKNEFDKFNNSITIGEVATFISFRRLVEKLNDCENREIVKFVVEDKGLGKMMSKTEKKCFCGRLQSEKVNGNVCDYHVGEIRQDYTDQMEEEDRPYLDILVIE